MKDKIIRLRTGRKGHLKTGHPWIYKSQILKKTGARPGDIVTVVNSEGKFIGRGYFNPKSEISVRLLTFNDEEINREFFRKRIEAAVKKRKDLLKKTNAYRAVFSEADGLPGLIADVYGGTVVFQALTLGMEKLKNVLVEDIKEVIKPKYIFERSESIFRKIEDVKDIKRWWGDKGDPIIEIYEGKARFLVDIENGHKTGFYLDQRKSRMAMDGISKGKRVLDLFCYTGGFSIWAAVCGASRVQGVDIKREWLELAVKNAEINGVSQNVGFIEGDAFLVLRDFNNSGEKFDIIIIDPPSFAKKKESIASASKGYEKLNLAAMKALNEGGILATFSCSHNISNEIFSDTLKRAASGAGKKLAILKRCHQAEDHPIVKTIPETEYLKGYFLKINPAGAK